VQLSRREFLLGAAGLLTASGCAVHPGSDTGSQTITPIIPPGTPSLDRSLRLSLPQRAVARSTLRKFAHETSVRVLTLPQPPPTRFLLDLAAGEQGKLDVALVEEETLRYLMATGLVEPIDKTLVPERKLISAPFNNPPYDPGGARSIGKDYSVIGFATTESSLVDPPGSWKRLFQYARANPHRVEIPNDSEVAVGAAMVALGHPWSSANPSDLADAKALLGSLTGKLAVGGRLDRSTIDDRTAVIASGLGFREPTIGVHFVVPSEGTIIRMRSYCVLALAPDPVSSHAFLNATLDPQTVKADVQVARLASTVGASDYLIPSSLMDNTAIYPPAELADVIVFSTTTDAGAVARRAVWDSVKT
jgi:spermidine/putrescine transport system substrate-binding protein